MNNGNCTQLCLPLGSTSVSCACAMGFALASDGNTCESVDTFLIYSTATGTEVSHIIYQTREEMFMTYVNAVERVGQRTDNRVVLTKL